MQAQSLQAQTQTLQALQEQYGNVMAALLPQLPLLQAIPLHIDTVRNSLTETLNTKLAQTLRSGVTAPLTARHSRSTSSTDVPSSHNNLLPRKKRRLENDESESYTPLH